MRKVDYFEGFESFVNKEFYFYGAKHFRFRIDDMVLYAIPDDRGTFETNSFLSYICHDNNADIAQFSEKPIAKVKIFPIFRHEEKMEGWKLIDIETEHIWLKFGTCHTDVQHGEREFGETDFAFYYTPPDDIRFIEVEKDYVPYRERHPEEVVKHATWFGGYVPDEEFRVFDDPF